MKQKKLLIIFLCMATHLFALQLGDGTDTNRYTPVKIMDDVAQVSAGAFHTLIVKKDGSLWGTGDNEEYALGLEYPIRTSTPIKIMEDVKTAIAGSFYSLVIKNDGSMWEFGLNHLGGNTRTYSSYILPRKVDDDVVFASTGSRYVLYIKKDYTVWGFGEDLYGVFGNGVQRHIAYPKKLFDGAKYVYADSIYSLLITKAGELMITGSHYYPIDGKKAKRTNIWQKIADDVVSASDGFYIDKNGALYGFGFNGYGELGLGNNKDTNTPATKVMNDVMSVSSTQGHSLILKKDGSLYVCGGDTPNYFGALGTGTRTPELTPKLLMTDVKQVSAGRYHSAILKNDGSLWMCGANDIPSAL